MKAPSIQARLLAGAAVAIFMALGVAWVAMGFLFERHVSQRLNAELRANAEELVASLAPGSEGAPTLKARLTDSRFSVTNSGYFWQVSTPAGVLRSGSLGGKDLNRLTLPSRDRWATRIEDGPAGNDLYYLERIVPLGAGGPDALVQFAHDHNSIAVASTEFSLELGQFLLILGGFLCLASWAQVYLGLRPFSQVRGQLAKLERDPAARLEGGQPRELRPLVDAINSLAATRERDLQRARWRAADLAHSLKTPLAVLDAHSRRLRAQGAHETAEGIERAVAAAATAVQFELAQTRSAIVGHGKAGALVRKCAEQLVQVIDQTDAGARIVFEIDVDDDIKVAASEEALTETLGPILENSARYARRLVRISAEFSDGDISIAVEDDGPGLADNQLEHVLQRGARLDERPGHGLGLAIARDIVEGAGGAISLGRGKLPGLRVITTWPAA
jgi:signal transduction histidine kinase